jgi:stearoyl-CoA desaturase (delta-9 desaturase)
MLFKNIPFYRVNWLVSFFLIGTFITALIGVPIYIWLFGLSWAQITLFLAFFIATGMSITFGYHRLFAHRAFETHPLIRFFCLIFGAGAFEGSVIEWVSDHRRHHKHVDHDDDPYDISKGLFYAHIGWILFKLRPEPPLDNVNDLRKDRWIRWQHRNWYWIGGVVTFVMPTILGYLLEGGVGALGGFLIGGVARLVCVQHCTFCINSLCHYLGTRPYSKKCSARDSWIMALVTFGEGYHNYHHEFQHDYRNGVKPWQWDPTKWTIWTLSKLGLAHKLRTVPDDKIHQAEIENRTSQ